MYTSAQIAEMLNGREYGEETTSTIVNRAHQSGLVIVYGYSDDNCEFEGAFHEEIPCWQGQKIYFNKDGSNFTNEYGECFLTYHKDKDQHEENMIEAVWCENEKVYNEKGDYYSWTYKTDIPHEQFDILEDGGLYCRGIVFSVNDLK